MSQPQKKNSALYILIALVLIFASVITVTNLTNLRDAIEDRDDSKLSTDRPTEPEIRKATITPFQGGQVHETTIVLQNPHLASIDQAIIVQNSKTSTAADTVIMTQEGFEVIDQYSSTGDSVSAKPTTFVYSEENIFQGMLNYQDPQSGSSYTIDTDGHLVYPLTRAPKLDGSVLSYHYVNLDNVVSVNIPSQPIIPNSFQLKTTLAYERSIDLDTQEYTDKALTLPEVLTEQQLEVYTRNEQIFARDAVHLSQDKDMYSTENGVLYKDNEEIGSVILPEGSELRIEEVIDNKLYATISTQAENSIDFNILEYDLGTGIYRTVFQIDDINVENNPILSGFEIYNINSLVELP